MESASVEANDQPTKLPTTPVVKLALNQHRVKGTKLNKKVLVSQLEQQSTTGTERPKPSFTRNCFRISAETEKRVQPADRAESLFQPATWLCAACVVFFVAFYGTPQPTEVGFGRNMFSEISHNSFNRKSYEALNSYRQTGHLRSLPPSSTAAGERVPLSYFPLPLK